MTKTPFDLELTWTFPQTSTEVFDAWTRPDRLAQWWRFPGYSIPADHVDVDARAGGTWSVTAVSDTDGSEIPFKGEIREITPDSLLVIALVDEPTPGAADPSRMVVKMHTTPSGSGLEFHHLGFGNPESVEELRDGYTGFFFPNLAEFLAAN
jgi:uncharacterized protein YndB with AHSA1/START domain